jgi:hypothetical protein
LAKDLNTDGNHLTRASAVALKTEKKNTIYNTVLSKGIPLNAT